MLIQDDYNGRLEIKDFFDDDECIEIRAYDCMGVDLNVKQLTALRDHLNKLLEENANPST